MIPPDLKQKLESNPRLAFSTIRIYLNQIDVLTNTYGENPTKQQLNMFIADKCRKRQPTAKYAVREYLDFKDRSNEYQELVQAKIKRPIKPKVFLTSEELNLILDSIKKDKYKVMGKLQMAFVARASGIIKIEKRRIRKEKERVRFILMEKRQKPKKVYLRMELWPMVEPYYNLNTKYLFMGQEAEKCNDEQLNIKVQTVYNRYLEQLQAAAKLNNIDMSTHDIRRSVANLINNATKDPRIAQKLLDHESMDTTEKYLADNTEEANNILLNYQKGIM